MKLTWDKESKRFVCESTYHERMIPKQARFRWDPAKKQWWTDDKVKAAKLAEYASDEVVAMFAEEAAKAKEALEASRAADANIDLPAPDGLDYFPFQRAGIAYALSHPNTLFGDEMGLGKTIQALGVINTDETIKKVLVICPASLRLNWKREAETWLIRDYSIGIVESKNGWVDADIVIINYDILKKFHDQVHSVAWDMMIVDECHYLKNAKAQRTKEVLGAWNKDPEKRMDPIAARRKVFLTGTPIPNRPIEGFTIFKALAPDVFRSWMYYAKRYCAAYQGRWGWDVSGSSNLDELQEKLRTNFMVRRLKADVMTELPAKTRQVILLPVNGCSHLVRNESRILAEHEEMIADIQAEVELAKASDDDATYETAVKKLQQAMQVMFTAISKVRHETAVGKVPAVIDHVKNALEDGRKIVVFAHHKDVIAALAKEFSGISVTLTGDTPMQTRQDNVDRFQDDPDIKLFIGSIQASGVGLTLTAASHVIFAELDWVPGNVSQAEDRCHRIGQDNAVLIQHLVLDGSLDAKMAKTLVAKQAVLDDALDKNHPDAVDEAKKMVELEKSSTASVRRAQVAKQAEKITAEQSAAVLTGLRRLSAMCDGAMAEDGMGFNKIDTRIGKSLAAQESLSPKQAVLGARLVNKYRGQLNPELVAAATGKEIS